MKKVKKIQFINDYNRMSLKDMAKDYGVSVQTLEKYVKALALKSKKQRKQRNLLITDLNEQELDRFRRIAYGPSKDWRVCRAHRNKETPLTPCTDRLEDRAFDRISNPYKTGIYPKGKIND